MVATGEAGAKMVARWTHEVSLSVVILHQDPPASCPHLQRLKASRMDK